MRSKIRWLTAGMVIGFALGAILLIYWYNYPPEQISKDDSKEILDDVVLEWTISPDSGGVLAAYLGGRNKSRIFQLGKIPDTVRVLAHIVDSLYKVPESVVISQWILESKWGLCSLGAENYFGHSYAATKKYLQHPRYVVRMDKILVNGKWIPKRTRFSRYQNIAESFLVHGKYIAGSPLYRDAFKHVNSPEKFARSIAKTYALDPEYGLKLVTLMRRYKLN